MPLLHYHEAPNVTELPSGRCLARAALEEYLGRIFRIEHELDELCAKCRRAGLNLPAEKILKRRREQSAAIFIALKNWVDDLPPGMLPKSALGKVLSYTVSQWLKLVLHLEHPEVPAHNNYLENQIRPFAIGRRAWLFANNPFGTRASANLYSLAATARANGLAPYAYLRCLFEKLPLASTVETLEALLPFKATAASVIAARAA